MPRRADLISLFDDQGRVRALREVERDAVMFALRQHDLNVTAAARALGVTKVTVYALLRGYGLDIGKIRKDAQR